MTYNSKKLKIFLLFVIIFSSGIILISFISSRLTSNTHEDLISAVKEKANLSINNIHQTATKDGIKQWNLDAASIHLINSGKEAVFKDLSVIFFLENNNKVYLTAEQGRMTMGTNDMEVTGNVMVINKNFKLKTEKLHYVHNTRILYTNIAVSISGPSLNFTAKSMKFDLNTNQTQLGGNVKGAFSESLI